MAAIKFLVDENVPADVTTFLRSRGHEVFPVGEYFAKSSPDHLLVTAAEQNGLVVITFDKDFKRLITQVPVGYRGKFGASAGRISLHMKETEAPQRIIDMLPTVEFHYHQSLLNETRFIMQMSLSTITVRS